MDDSSEIAENTNAQDNSDNTTGNTSMCPATWLIILAFLVAAAAVAAAAFAVYQWRKCAQADAQADVAAISVAVERVANPYDDIFQRGMEAYNELTPRYRSDLYEFD